MLDSKPQIRRTAAGVGLLCGLWHSGGAFALGFGDIRLTSALNQPLNARIELVSLSEAERNALSVRVAPARLFERFGIERTALADALQIEIEGSSGGDRVSVRLSTREPVREPFVHFLIEADTGRGRALREYTVLLDPPGFAPAAPATSTATTTRSVSPSVASPASSKPASVSNRTARTYGPIQAGDTLSQIASRTRRPGTTSEQMQVAIFRENPQAFNGNMSRLLRGTTLSIPVSEHIGRVSAAEALDVIRGQRRDLAATSSAPPAQSSPRAATPTPVVPETTAATLRLEAPPEAPSRPARTPDAHFGRLVEPDFDALPAAAPVAAQESISAHAQISTDTADTATPDTSADADIDAGSVTDIPAEAVPGDGVVNTPVADTTATSPEKNADAHTRFLRGGERDVAAAGIGLFSPRNIMLLLGIVILGGVLGVWVRRRQYKPVPLDFSATDTHDEPFSPRAGTDDEDSAAEQVIADATHPAPVVEAESSNIAPSVRVQNADRRMQEGRFDEAREILQEGLRQQPEEARLQDKLIELDYLSGNDVQFARDVDRFEPALVASGVRWAGVAAMGRVLLPTDPRFASTSGAASEDPATVDESDDAAAMAEPHDVPTMPEPVDETLDETGRSAQAQDYENRPQAAGDQRPPADAVYANGGASAQSATGEGLDIRRDTQEYLWAGGEAGSDDTDNTIAARPSFTIDVPDAGPRDAGSEPEQAGSLSETTAHSNKRSPILDSAASVPEPYDFKAQPLDAAGERQHDQGDEPGMHFELDAGAPESEHRALSPIDAGEFDMEDQADGPATGSEQAEPVEIRLDLARMYIEMEDHVVARELLEEAITEGDATQRGTAKQLLEKIA